MPGSRGYNLNTASQPARLELPQTLLKCSAVPTIFCHRRSPQMRKSPKKRHSTCTSEARTSVPLDPGCSEHNYCLSVFPEKGSSASEDSTTDADSTQEEMVQCAESRPQVEMQRRIKELESELRKTKRKCRGVMKAKARQEARVCRIFANDQIQSLSRGGMRGVKWRASTVKKALQLRFSCGSSGYKLLLQQHYPFPSERTLVIWWRGDMANAQLHKEFLELA
ncbi:PREDICTED: uncharacterized protein LOC106814379 [Priapulus caudatus]|uniref:Uncharacterized protein LOC106814379 n=1 Tax=Priapulus caudatus TaxID=37621 RepID=A0ABM1EPQ3_PRICU|nr:PREDICTED: uncharacterized protein LOC106814379 [Priapulus caudatus]